MESIKIKGEIRKSTGKKDSKILRKAERTPCVLYGGEKNFHFSVLEKDLKKLIFTPNIYLVDIELDGNKHKGIVQDIQFHPVKDNVIHIDFLEIFEDKSVTINIPVKLEGLAVGVKDGGHLQIMNRKLKVKGLYKNLPDTLNINVEHVTLGKTVKVGELSFENLELLNSKNTVVASVKLTRAAKGMSETEEEEGQEEEKEVAEEKE